MVSMNRLSDLEFYLKNELLQETHIRDQILVCIHHFAPELYRELNL